MGPISPLDNEKKPSALKRLGKSFRVRGGVGQRAAMGGVLMFALNFTSRGIGLVRIAILVRLLSPTDFGLMGIALLAIAAIENFSETGFRDALIQNESHEETGQTLDTAWWLLVARGIILGGLLALTAPLIATFFREPQATTILRVVALALILRGLANMGTIYFRKDLEFQKVFVYRFTAVFGEALFTIAAAFVLRNIWALVLGFIFRVIIELILSFWLHPYRPRLRFDVQQARQLFSFGKWLLASSVLVFLSTRGDNAIVGRMFGATMLGLYLVAFQIANLASTEITKVLATITFPTYSKLQNDKVRLQQAYLMTVQYTSAFVFLITVVLVVFTGELTELFLGKKWLEIVPLLPILAVAGLIRAMSNAGPLFKAVGEPRYKVHTNLARVFVLGILFYPFADAFGMVGLAWAVLASVLVAYVINTREALRIIRLHWASYLRILAHPFFAATLSGVVILILRPALSESILTSIGLIILLGVIYCLWMAIAWRSVLIGQWRQVRRTGRLDIHGLAPAIKLPILSNK